jgi:hypothetical protein
MHVLQAVLCALLLAQCASLAVGLQAGAHSASSKVVVLTDEDFDERTSSSGDWLINIYAPWRAPSDAHLPSRRALRPHAPGAAAGASTASSSSPCGAAWRSAWQGAYTLQRCALPPGPALLRGGPRLCELPERPPSPCLLGLPRDKHKEAYLLQVTAVHQATLAVYGRSHIAGGSAAQVDGESNRVLVKRFLVEAYPSIYLVRSGKVYVYEDGPRSEEQARARAPRARPPCALHCAAAERARRRARAVGGVGARGLPGAGAAAGAPLARVGRGQVPGLCDGVRGLPRGAPGLALRRSTAQQRRQIRPCRPPQHRFRAWSVTA